MDCEITVSTVMGIVYFDHFVRNRHFSIEQFTDRRPIFIDVSVNAEKLWKNKLCPPV